LSPRQDDDRLVRTSSMQEVVNDMQAAVNKGNSLINPERDSKSDAFDVLSVAELLEGLRAHLETQRACFQEATIKLCEVERCGVQLEAQLARAVDRLVAPEELVDQGEGDAGLTGSAKESQLCVQFSEAEQSNDDRGSAAQATQRSIKEDDAVSALATDDQAHKAQFSSGGGRRRGGRGVSVRKPSGRLMDNLKQLELDEASARVIIDDHTESSPSRTFVEGLVKSPKFDMTLGALIVFNTMIMSLQIEYQGQILSQDIADACRPNCPSRTWHFAEVSFLVLEQFFTVAFAVELALRMSVDGWRYLKSWSNFGDALIVIVSSIDSWVLTPIGNNGFQNVAILRLVRLVRLSKVLRVVRVMKAFKSLRVLVSAVAYSVGALGWSMTLLFVFELIGAIFLAQVLRPIIEEEEDEELRDFLVRKFGTWTHSMMSLFEITMAPGGFIAYRVLYEQVHVVFGLFIATYVCVVTFAVVRVITAMFLKATLSASDHDEARTAKDKAKQRDAYSQRLRELVESEDPAGRITEEEFVEVVRLPNMREWLEDLSMTEEAAMRLFRAMEKGGGQILFAEFIVALMRTRGGPKGADSVVMLWESLSSFERIKALHKAMIDCPVDHLVRSSVLSTAAPPPPRSTGASLPSRSQSPTCTVPHHYATG